MELRIGSNIMIYFSSFYIAAFHTAQVFYISVYIVSCHICITFYSHLT